MLSLSFLRSEGRKKQSHLSLSYGFPPLASKSQTDSLSISWLLLMKLPFMCPALHSLPHLSLMANR